MPTAAGPWHLDTVEVHAGVLLDQIDRLLGFDADARRVSRNQKLTDSGGVVPQRATISSTALWAPASTRSLVPSMR